MLYSNVYFDSYLQKHNFKKGTKILLFLLNPIQKFLVNTYVQSYSLQAPKTYNILVCCNPVQH